MNVYTWSASLAGVLVVVGCQSDPFADHLTWPTERSGSVQIESSRAPVGDAGVGVSQEVPESVPAELSLRDAMALAVARSPRLQAFAWDVRQAEAKALQAGLWSNPELAGEVENIAGSGDFSGTESSETTVSLAQTFPIGGDIDRRKELAEYGSRLAMWDYEAARLEVLTDVTTRYVAVLGAQRRVAMTRDMLELAQQVQTTTQKRVDAGDAPPLESVRASVPVANAQVAARRSARELEAARKQLAFMWASDHPRFETLTGSLSDIALPPSVDQLVSLLNENPAIARWATQISARRAEAALAKAEATPDLTARLGYKYDRADDAGGLVVGVSLPLPIFDRQQGASLAARLGAHAAEQRQRQAELRLEAMLSEAYAQLANAHDEASAIRDVSLPPATEAFEVTRRAFENADLSLLDLLDSQRTLFDLQTRYVDALIEYHTAAAEIESLIGRRLPAFDSPPHLEEPQP